MSYFISPTGNLLYKLNSTAQEFLSHVAVGSDGEFLWDGLPFAGTNNDKATAYFVSDTSDGRQYSLTIGNGILETREIIQSYTFPVVIIIIDTITGIPYQLTTTNGVISIIELSSGIPQNNTLVDYVTNLVYRLAIIDRNLTIMLDSGISGLSNIVILAGLDNGSDAPGTVLQAEILNLIELGIDPELIFWVSTGTE